MQFLRQSTAGQVVEFGPFVDSTDGNTQETALTIANTDIRLLKHGATSEVAASTGGTHISAGRFYTTLGATDSDTIGRLVLSCHVAGALAVRREFQVLHANVFDVLFGTVAPSTITQAGVRGAVGLASADLDSQLAAIPTTEPLDATATEAAALAALVSHGVLVTGGDVNLVSVAGVAVAGVGDFRTDVSGLLTKSQFDAALPDNFSGLAIDLETGAVIAGNMVAAAPTAADIWAYATRSLTVSSGGTTAQEVWEYATRELTSIDLSGVEINALTPTQAAWLEAIYGKTALIGTDGALAVVVTPIGSGGEITLYSGVDYVDTAAGPLIIPVPAAVQSRVPAVDQPVYFQGRRRRTGTYYFDVAGVVIDDPDSPGSKAVSVPIPRGSIDSEFPFDDNWFYFVGDRAGSLQDAFIAGALKICPGPIPPA